MRELFVPLVISVSLHAGILGALSTGSFQPARFSVEEGEPAIMVELVGSARERAEDGTLAAAEVEPPSREISSVPKTGEPLPRRSKISRAENKEPSSSGSALAGEAPDVERRSEGGAGSSGKSGSLASPDYLRNPPPRYPDSARRANQQGLVELEVEVSAAGAAIDVTLLRSSGFPVLDAAAVRAVADWKFKAATLNGAPVSSTIVVPVRFELKAGR